MTSSVATELQEHVPGFKASFGGEELKRAQATLQGAMTALEKSARTPLQLLTEHSDLHVRELAFAARQYASAAVPGDHEALYHAGLVLQELAAKVLAGSPEQVSFLKQACERYEAALAAKPSSHTVLYNWGVALSDLARALKPTAPGEAAASLSLASNKYAASLQWNPANPQALNNWGLVLQELATDAADRRDWGERDLLVRAAMEKFRMAIRLQPEFDRGCYNLGTVFYTFASAQAKEPAPSQQAGKGGKGAQAHDLAVRALLSTAAQYIALAHALQPAREVYRKSLPVVRGMLPLPFLRAGYLTAPLARTLGEVGEVLRREWFVLDHVSMRAATSMESSMSAATAGVKTGSRLLPQQGGEEEPLVLGLGDVRGVRRCADPSLPEGHAFWVATTGLPLGVYFVAEDAEAADAWVDALLLASHLVRSRGADAMAEALAPPQRRGSTVAHAGG